MDSRMNEERLCRLKAARDGSAAAKNAKGMVAAFEP